MLQDSLLGTRYNQRIFLVVEQHTDHRCLRNDTSDFWQNLFYFLWTEKRFRETRAVVVINGKDFFLKCVITLHCRVHSQISSLGMPSESNHGLHVSPIKFQIFQCFSMRGHNSVAQVKIFFPSYNGIVRSTKRNICSSVRKFHCNCRKLLRFPEKDLINISSCPAFSKSFWAGHFFKKNWCILQKSTFCFHLSILFFSGKYLKKFFHRKSIPVFYISYFIQIQIRKTCQYQIVYLIKGCLFKSKIPSPVQIIQNISH